MVGEIGEAWRLFSRRIARNSTWDDTIDSRLAPEELSIRELEPTFQDNRR